MKFRVVLVEPEYQVNLGSVCRVMKNFGFKDLYLLNPKCDPNGFNTKMYSKHAKDILQKARIVKSFDKSVAGCSFVIGTTGVLRRHRGTFRNPLHVKDLVKLKSRLRGEMALVFGREGIGLNKKEIDSCDFLVTIPTSVEYPTMNLSHSVAVVLYELSQIKTSTMEEADKNEKNELLKVFNAVVDHYKKGMKNPGKVKTAFKRVVGKALISKKEVVAIMSVLHRVNKNLKKEKKE